jgi:hypothetical protein
MSRKPPRTAVGQVLTAHVDTVRSRYHALPQPDQSDKEGFDLHGAIGMLLSQGKAIQASELLDRLLERGKPAGAAPGKAPPASEVQAKARAAFEAAWPSIGRKVHEAGMAGKFQDDDIRKRVKKFDAAYAAVVEPMNRGSYDQALKALPALHDAVSSLVDKVRAQSQALAAIRAEDTNVHEKEVKLRRVPLPTAKAVSQECEGLRRNFGAQMSAKQYLQALKVLKQCDAKVTDCLANKEVDDWLRTHAAELDYEKALVEQGLPKRHDDAVARFPKGTHTDLDRLLDAVAAARTKVNIASSAKKFGEAKTLVDNDWDGALTRLETDGPGLMPGKAAAPPLPEEQEFNDEFEAFQPLSAQAMTVRTKPADPFGRHWDAIDKHFLAMDKARKASDFKLARTCLGDLVKACEALRDAGAALDARNGADARNAADEAKTAAQNGMLAAKPLDYKLELLQRLRSTAAMSAGSTPEQWDAQKEVFRAMTMDPGFVEQEAQTRKQIVQKLVADPAVLKQLKEARAGWSDPAKCSSKDKIDVLRKALIAQSEALGFGKEVPGIVEVNTGPDENGTVDNGEMQPDGKIRINMHPESSVHDFERALDLIFHENSHNYQNKLVKQLEAGQLKPGTPLYNQARMFQANQATEHGSYVRSSDPAEFDDYQRQPIEDHAHTNGPKTAKAVIKALA